MPCLAKTSAISRSRGRLRIRLTVRSIPRSVYGRLPRDAGEVEFLEPYRRDADAGLEVVVVPGLQLGLPGQRGGAGESLHHRLGEAHVLDRAGDLAVLDQESAVAGHARELGLLGVDDVDVPEPGHPDAALDPPAELRLGGGVAP